MEKHTAQPQYATIMQAVDKSQKVYAVCVVENLCVSCIAFMFESMCASSTLAHKYLQERNTLQHS